LAIGLLSGCGGSDDPPKQNAAPAPQAAAPAESPVPPAAEQPPAPPPRQAKADVADAPEPEALDPNVDPHDAFEVAAVNPPFKPAEGADGSMSPDSFEATMPVKGVDSNDFDAVDTPAPPQPSAAPAKEESEKPKKAEPPPASKGHTPIKPKKTTGRTPAKKTDEETEKPDADTAKTLPAGFHAIAAYGYSPVGWPLRIHSSRDGAEMALVTGGAVTVGHDGGPPESSPQINVVLDTFYMDVTEVTLERYERYRQALNEERGRSVVPLPENSTSPPNFPVLGVTYKQAEFYAHWAQKELPTETEWERAARGESAFAHPWGNGRAIWTRERKRNTISAAKSFMTDISPFGIYDLAGNAREWCSDRWSPHAFEEAAQNSSRTQLRNWKGPHSAEQADFHVVKGNGPGWDAWDRVGRNGTQHHSDVGFRCVLRLTEKD
jgi:formylglycine-generating enzyme required for sulfatase activity